MSSATKAQSQKIFEKLKTKPANKVGNMCSRGTELNVVLSITGLL